MNQSKEELLALKKTFELQISEIDQQLKQLQKLEDREIGIRRIQRVWKEHCPNIKFKPDEAVVSKNGNFVDYNSDGIKISIKSRETWHLDDYDTFTKTEVWIHDKLIFSEDV